MAARALDHVLREEEREHDAFSRTCSYVRENPVRKGLTANSTEYAYASAMLPGFPDIAPNAAKFWDAFWREYNRKLSA